MAYVPGNLSLVSSVNGFGLYRYDSTDTVATVDGSGYFNNADDDLNLAVGDFIDVVVWATAVRSGTISDVGKVIVLSVSAAGVVDCSDDLVAQAVASGD